MKCSLKNVAFNNIILLTLSLVLMKIVWQWNLTGDAYAYGVASGVKLLLLAALSFVTIFVMVVVAYQRPSGDRLKDFVTKMYELS